MRTSLFAIIAALFTTALLGAAAEPLTPRAVFLRCQDAVNALPMPQYVAFTLHDDGEWRQQPQLDSLRIVARTSDAHSYVRTILDRDGDPAPPEPRVVTGDIFPGTILYRIADFPLADFGMRRTHTRPGIFDAPGTPEPLPSGLKEIAGVHTVYVPYDIEDLGDTDIDGHPVYHYRLRPKRDAGHNVLREIWIDRDSYLPRRYVAERYVGAGIVPFRYNVTVNTQIIDGHLVNHDADGTFNVNRALVIHFYGSGHWRISDVSFPQAAPSWIFDEAAFLDHQFETPPDL